jgi:RNA polymerase sigma-70 factor (ECF subfamily)
VSGTSPSDADLVRRSATGDDEAFRVLFDRKYRSAYLTAYQMIGDRALAEDVVQEAFLALWKHCARYRAEFTVDTWLRRIVTSRSIDRWRSEKRHVERRTDREPDSRDLLALVEATRDAEADPSLRTRWRELQALWDRLAADLPPQQRAAFVLREIEELSAAEVAAALDCSTSTVRTHVSLARKALREALAREVAADDLPQPPG